MRRNLPSSNINHDSDDNNTKTTQNTTMARTAPRANRNNNRGVAWFVGWGLLQDWLVRFLFDTSTGWLID